jgi:hypothetical protein
MSKQCNAESSDYFDRDHKVEICGLDHEPEVGIIGDELGIAIVVDGEKIAKRGAGKTWICVARGWTIEADPDDESGIGVTLIKDAQPASA